MSGERERYRDRFDCPVVHHEVILTGEISRIRTGGGHLPVMSVRIFGDCTGLNECRIDPKSKPKPTGCPYYDHNCTS